MKAAGEIHSARQVVKTPSNIDRRIYFLDRSISELLSNTQFNTRYAPEDLILNAGSGVDYVDLESLYIKGEYLNPPFEDLPSHYKTYAQILDLAEKHSLRGGCHVFVAACVASTQAIGLSYRMLKKGMKKAILTGGSESMISYINYIGFYLLGAMASGYPAPEACKPFDKRRNGTVLGEGAVVMLLEDSESAPKDKILAEIAGYGSTMDAYAVTDPDPSALRLSKAIEIALHEAGIGPDLIDCVHLHGTGTPKNAPAEYLSLKRVFGSRVAELPVYSMKGQIGHLIAACGAMEMLGVIYSIQNQVVLPTVNFRETDPEAPLYVIRDTPLHIPVRYVLKLNSAFGGENTAIIIKKHE